MCALILICLIAGVVAVGLAGGSKVPEQNVGYSGGGIGNGVNP